MPVLAWAGRSVAVFVIVAIQPVVHAQEQRVISRARHVFENDACDLTSTCSLLRVRFLTEDYLVMTDKGPHYGTRFFAQYETDSIAALEDYVFVQFVKGCLYMTRVQEGLVVPIYHRERYEKGDLFRFDNWVLDSYNDDPVYSSYAGMGRHILARYNTVPGSFEQGTERLYRNGPPPMPELYVGDHPSTAFVSDRGAQNVSLRFRMCLFKSVDVPATVSGNSLDPAVPITCYEWGSSFVFDHSRNVFRWPYNGPVSCPSEPFPPQ
jgi:hypothetical protein